MFFRGLISRQFQQLQQQQQRPFHSTLKMNDFSSFFDNSKGWSWNEKELLTGMFWAPERVLRDIRDNHTVPYCNVLYSTTDRTAMYYTQLLRYIGNKASDLSRRPSMELYGITSKRL